MSNSTDKTTTASPGKSLNSKRRLMSSVETAQLAMNVLHGNTAPSDVPDDVWRALCREYLKHRDLSHHRGQRISRLETMRSDFKQRMRKLGCPKDESAESWAVSELSRLSMESLKRQAAERVDKALATVERSLLAEGRYQEVLDSRLARIKPAGGQSDEQSE